MIAVCCMVDLSLDTGIHVSDIAATMQSLGLLSASDDNHRCLLLLIKYFIKMHLQLCFIHTFICTVSYFTFNGTDFLLTV